MSLQAPSEKLLAPQQAPGAIHSLSVSNPFHFPFFALKQNADEAILMLYTTANVSPGNSFNYVRFSSPSHHRLIGSTSLFRFGSKRYSAAVSGTSAPYRGKISK